MKIISLILLSIMSSSAFAGFACSEATNGSYYLVRKGPKPLQVDSLEECQSSIEKSKNGFVCIKLSNAQGVRNKVFLVFSESEMQVLINSNEECQEIVDKSQNGFACKGNSSEAWLYSNNSPAFLSPSLEKCLDAIGNSKLSLD